MNKQRLGDAVILLRAAGYGQPNAEDDVAIAEQMLPAGVEVLPPYHTGAA